MLKMCDSFLPEVHTQLTVGLRRWGFHEQVPTFAGAYLATAGHNHKLVVYSVSDASIAAERTFEARVTSVDWKPQGNAILCMLHSGEIHVWENVISTDHVPPCQAVEKASAETEQPPEPTRSMQPSREHERPVPSANLGPSASGNSADGRVCSDLHLSRIYLLHYFLQACRTETIQGTGV